MDTNSNLFIAVPPWNKLLWLAVQRTFAENRYRPARFCACFVNHEKRSRRFPIWGKGTGFRNPFERLSLKGVYLETPQPVLQFFRQFPDMDAIHKRVMYLHGKGEKRPPIPHKIFAPVK